MTPKRSANEPEFGTADLTNCDREPIHIPGSIQPHGAMLVYDPSTQIVTHASVNAAAMLGIQLDAVVGQGLHDVLGADAAHAVYNTVAKSVAPAVPGLLFGHKIAGSDKRFDVAAHTYLGRTFLEFQESAEGADAYGPLELTRALVRRLADEKSVPRLAVQAARMVQLMIGYDRVMIYKLLHNGAGRVIAEHKRADLGSFLNQHFPASDIPVQARELYKRNWIRMISDARFTPQQVLPAIPQSQQPLDMSYAQLRAVSPVHCEYLQNMGVHASMSISVMVEGELWGLIACHHYSPKTVSLPQRVGAELFGQYFSLQVETLERREGFEVANKARARLDRIVAELPPEEELHESLSSRIEDIAQLVPCDGAALWINRAWIPTGAVPHEAMIKPMATLLDHEAQGEVWSTNQIARFIPEAADHIENVAGMLAIPISHSPRDYMLFFRSEESRFIDWGGEPVKQVGPLGDRLTPRKSFDMWREEVRGQSTPWTDADLAIADAVQNYLRDVVLRHTEATAEEKKRTEVRRKLVNEELNHRVKNILALAKSIVEQSRSGVTDVNAYVDAVSGRLQALAFAHDQISRERGGGDVGSLMESELAAYGGSMGQDRTDLEGVPVRLESRAYSSLALVAHELATNAAKYGALSNATGKVTVHWSLQANGDFELSWAETGGPKVVAPKSSGFGSTLIGRVIPFDLGGKAEVEYPPEGAKARFVIPAKFVLPADAAETSVAKPKGEGSARVSLAGLRVLLVEDQVLIALDAENSLRLLGASQVVIAPSAEHAMKAINQEKPDLAVLDVNLGDHTSTPIAEALRNLGVPFMFATGYGDTVMLPDSMRTVPIVRKPYAGSALEEAVASLLQSRGK
ncbi:MAG TPA: HWE histidine kinase domain-containing protein [Hyphomonadaceae bacterium]|nr:HWE histidine kinase domain-containing protein [Hyphomonadaceae bacterium]HPN06262.1 HWE histidine kinase domain-containing protein [Hyphomonadaceae bacterium]